MKGEAECGSNRLAVLIDAENASANLIEPLLEEIAKYGTAYVKRIYGDWTSPQLNSWKTKLNKLAIQPIQQFRYTTGKNATDSALIIDAMDLLYTRNFDGFCIVSSDSDFTRLASRIRESGLVVYGFGEEKTPEAFVSACDRFIYSEILEPSEMSTGIEAADSAAKDLDKSSSHDHGTNVIAAVDRQKLKSNKKLSKLLKAAYEAIADEDGWANLGPFGAQLTKLSPAFDARNYGYKKLGELIRATDMFEVRETPHGRRSAAKELHVKLKL